MKKTAWTLGIAMICTAVLFFALVGALKIRRAGRYRDAVESQINWMRDLNKILKEVKDEVAAKAAVGKVEELARRARQMSEDLKGLDPPKDLEEDLKAKYELEARKVTRELRAHLTRLERVKGGEEVLKAFRRGTRKAEAELKEKHERKHAKPA